MAGYLLGFHEIDITKMALVGGKGANLGELARIEGINVPAGFCVSTAAFDRIIGATPALQALIDRLALLKADDREAIGALGGEIRRIIEAAAIPDDIQAAVGQALAALGENNAYAIRSSATAEDLPAASFAGQQDSYLNISGKAAILSHISQCWASLFTDRAITYRIRNGFGQRAVSLAVVVQRMVLPQAAGTLFTADPVTANRKLVAIEASFGLGEALVAGLVNADSYAVRDGAIVAKTIGAKMLAIQPRPAGGTQTRPIEPERQHSPALTDGQILRLERIGRVIEAHFGRPQDIEWCLADDTFFIVQSRPITTAYPIPATNDQENHVYVSVGHQQMMTDAMKPLGLSVWQLTAARPMYHAGGRLFVDVAADLASPARRAMLVEGLGRADPLIKDALTTLIERGDFIPPAPAAPPASDPGGPPAHVPPPVEPDPAVVAELIERSQAAVAALKHTIAAKSGLDLLDCILDDIQQLKQSIMDPRSFSVIMAAMNASWWLNDKLREWLGEKNAADTLSQSVPNNITAQMGLDLLDVADALRPYPEVIAYLQRAGGADFFAGLLRCAGGQAAADAIRAYLEVYGVRCAGEIDITRPRWSENPAPLIPIILGNIKSFAPGASRRKFEQGRQEALDKERELLDRLRQLPDGEHKAAQTKRMIDLVRTFSGYREYPKYGIVSRYFVYRQALLQEAERLVRAGVIREREDISYLTFEELREAVRAQRLDYAIVGRRKDEHAFHERLNPPRVMTSDGEIISGAYKREHLPAGALAGLAVSSGVIEGRARVVLRMEAADLDEGDILVTAFTDPSWTPLFVAIKGLVTEVGGLMTHGAVIAREYGIPAVVGVENATRLISDGQRIRVHGTEGYVEILATPSPE